MPQAEPSRAIKLVGTEASDGTRRELSAGALTAVLDNGALRSIRYQGVEVLRGVAFLVRDKNWGTYAPAIEGLKIRNSAAGFTVSYTATCRDAEQAIRYEATISGKADGTLSFAAVGTPLSDFLTNRTGFVVLHPLEGIVDKPVEVVHTDGTREKRKFPKIISPGQPIFEIRSLKHTVMPGVTATVLMEGNKFEMEDHRNWMDASYKTYVCSLLDPWPYTLAKGEPFTQSVTLSIAASPKAKAAAAADPGVRVTVGGAKGRVPSVGVGVPMKQAQAALAEAALITAARPSHLVCQIDGREGGQTEAAAAFRKLKDKVGAPVTLEIVLPAKQSADKEVAAIAAAVGKGGLMPDALVITQMHDLKSFQPGSPRPWGPSYEEMAAAARKSFPGILLGGGMLSFFTELNRKRPPLGVFDFITHTLCPIVHAADDVSVMETLESLPWSIASTRDMIGKTPYRIGPSSIPCRDNPYGAAVAPNPHNGRVCLSDVDPRQRGLFAAAWNVALVAGAAKGGVEAVALGAVTGPQGVIYRKGEQVQPWYDQSGAKLFPVYHVLAGLGAASRAVRLETTSSAPARVAALAFKAKDGPALWLANLTADKISVSIDGFEGPGRLLSIDEVSFETAARQADFLASAGKSLPSGGAIELKPYGVAIVRSAAKAQKR